MSWEISHSRQAPEGIFPFPAGNVHGSCLPTAFSTVTLAANNMYSAPIFIPRRMAFSIICAEVTTLAASTLARLGVYAEGSGSSVNAPGGLVLDAGEIDTSTVGLKVLTINLTLNPGWYFLALLANGGPAMRANSQTAGLPLLAFTNFTDTAIHAGYQISQTYGALPGSWSSFTLSTNPNPRVLLGS